MKIKAWSLTIVLDNGEEMIITDLPNDVSYEIDNYLDSIEQELNEDMPNE